MPRTDLVKKADMKNIFLTLFLTIGLTSVGQNYIDYYNLANEAEYQIIDGGNLAEAKKTLVALDKKYGRLLFKDNFYLGILYYLDNDSINGNKYFAKYIANYGAPTYELPKFKNCFPQLTISNRSMVDLEVLQNKISTRFKDTVYFNKTIKSVNDSINYYVELDQKLLNDSNKINVGIQIPYLNYLKKYGIPKPGIFGEDYMIIFSHITDKNMQKVYKEFLLNEIMKGNACPESYATIVDKDLIETDETMYGTTFIKFSAKTSKEKVIENRKKIGLSPYYSGPNSYPFCNRKK